MLRTYKAVLRGNHVEWIDTPPAPARPTPVHITLLEDEPGELTARAQEMAAALESLARVGGLSSITDPAAWQRELRQDTPLSGREG
jgi:hypothetical protein